MQFLSRLSQEKDLVLCIDTFSHTLNRTHVDIQIHVNIFFLNATFSISQHSVHIS
jgi:hypothetical protein